MRFGLGILGFVVVAGTAAMILPACGTSVAELPGGNGGGGAGGASMTTVVSSSGGTMTTTGTGTTTTTTSSSSSSASSSSGGDSACVQDCALVQQCFGFDGCSQFGIDCANPNPQAKCVIDCIGQSNPTCQNLQSVAMMCFGACQNMGTTSSSSSTSSGGSSFQCVGCVTGPGGKCNAEVQACAMDNTTGCGMWFQCVGGCYQQNPVDPQCFDACDMQYPNAKPKFDPVYACSCAQCGTQCAAGDPCSHVPDAGP